jgi:hypothetical protein
VPFAMLALLAQDKWNAKLPTPGINPAILCLAVLLSPLSEFVFRYERFGGQLKAVVLVVLMYIGLKYPFQSAQDFLRANRQEPPPSSVALEQNR